MKVKELIEDLKHLPPDTEVYVYNPRWKVTPYISVVSTYDESNRRVLYLLSEVEEDIEAKMEAEKSANRKGGESTMKPITEREEFESNCVYVIWYHDYYNLEDHIQKCVCLTAREYQQKHSAIVTMYSECGRIETHIYVKESSALS